MKRVQLCSACELWVWDSHYQFYMIVGSRLRLMDAINSLICACCRKLQRIIRWMVPAHKMLDYILLTQTPFTCSFACWILENNTLPKSKLTSPHRFVWFRAIAIQDSGIQPGSLQWRGIFLRRCTAAMGTSKLGSVGMNKWCLQSGVMVWSVILGMWSSESRKQAKHGDFCFLMLQLRLGTQPI